MRALDLLARVLFRAVLGLILFVLVLFGAVQTPAGKALLAQLAGSLASGNGLTVQIRDLTGGVPWNIGIGEIALSDPQGPFARIEGLSLSWAPAALLSGTVKVHALTAERVDVLRRPDLPPSPAARGGSAPLPRIVLQHLAAADIRLAEPVAGQSAQLALDGSASLMEPQRGLSLAFTLTRKDQPGTVGGKASYAPDARILMLEMQAHEPPGGLVARLLGLEGLPALDAELRGVGPIDAWQGNLQVRAGTLASVQATAWIKSEGETHRLQFSAEGDVARALPPAYRPLAGDRVTLEGDARITQDLALSLSRVVAYAAVGNARASGTADLKGGTLALTFSAEVPDGSRFSAALPDASFQALTINGTLDGALATPRLVAHATVTGASGQGYGARSTKAKLRLTPDAAGYGWMVDATVEGLSAADPKVNAALGPAGGTISAAGGLPQTGAPYVRTAKAALLPLEMTFDGRAAREALDGTFSITRLDLAAFSPLAGRPLTGEMMLTAKLSRPSGGGFAADISGSGRGITTSEPLIDGMLGRTARLTGALAYGADGAVAVRDLKLNSNGLDVAVNGRIDRTAADLRAVMSLAEIGKVDSRVAGRLEADAAFSGSLEKLGVTARLAVPQGKAMGREVRDLRIDVTGSDLTHLPAGTLSASGTIGGKALTGKGAFATTADGGQSLNGLDLTLGTARAQGAVSRAASGLMTGRLQLAAPNVADLSALALTEMGGAVNATLVLDVDAGRQRIALQANATNVTAPGVRLDRSDINLTLLDPAKAPSLTGRAVLAGIDSNGFRIDRATLDASPAGANATNLRLDGVVQGTTIAASGRATTDPARYALRLDTLRLANGGATATLTAPSTFTSTDGAIAVDRFALQSGGGSAVVQGRVGDTLNLSADIRNLPLSLLAIATPTQGLAGTLSGQAQISGPASAPTGRYNLILARITQPDMQSAGVSQLDIRADGTFADGRATIRSSISGPSLSGVTLNGSVPMGAGNMDLALRGQVSLGIANAVLAVSGARASGNAAVDMTLRGTYEAPSAGGTVRVTNGRYDDAPNGVTIDRIEATLTGTDRSVTLSSFSARTLNGGSITGRGSVALDPTAGFPGEADITLQNAGVVNSDLMRLVVDGRLNVTGALATRPTVGGRIDVRSLDVNIPDRLTSAGAQINVRHVNVAPGTKVSEPRAAQARGMRANDRGRRTARASAPRPFVLGLNLTVAAPSRVFVRGMGIDAELGGQIALSGTNADPIANGGFQMRRGSFDILGRRLDFTRGILTFRGSTDPELDFTAESSASDVTARVNVTGSASDPDITFTSSPSLPEDEVIARLLFGKPTGQLSTGQALQLAQALAQYSGGGAQIDQLRRQFGLDSLSIGANAEGNGGEVGFGRRINDKVYLGVRQGTTAGSSRATIDVDVTKNIRIQGGAGADGSGEVGVGAQWDY